MTNACRIRWEREFVGHDVRTVPAMGWAGKKNGELLTLMAAAGFDVLVTTDRNLRHQQDLAVYGVAAVIMVAVSNRLADLVPLVADVETALRSLKPGQVVEVGN